MSVVAIGGGRSGGRPGSVGPGCDTKSVSKLLEKQVVVAVAEDKTHAWTVLQLAPSGLHVAVTMSDPVSSQMPLQPPSLQELQGMTIHRLLVRRDGGIATVAIETTARMRVSFARIGSKQSLASSLVRHVDSFLTTRFSVHLTPMLARPVSYPVALSFLLSPNTPELERKGTIFQPKRADWSPVGILPLPQAVTDACPPTSLSTRPNKACTIQ